MSGGRWGADHPPVEAYGRVTNAERFESLHGIAAELLRQLERAFDVQRMDGYGLDADIEQGTGRLASSARLEPQVARRLLAESDHSRYDWESWIPR